MRRLSGTGKPAKRLRRKTAGPTRRKPAEPVRPQTPSVAQLQEQNATLTRELSEAREQQTASAEVLRVISSSPGELEPVFQAMLENAVRICGAKFGNLLLVEGDSYRHVALHGAPQAFLEERQREPIIRPRPGSDLDRIRRTKQVIHTADMQVEGAAATAFVELAGARTCLDVPMLKNDELIGLIGMLEGSNRPRVTDPAASSARDLFEAGLNEAAVGRTTLWAFEPSVAVFFDRGALGDRAGSTQWHRR